MNSSPLDNKHVAIIGFGSQGRAQALNLRDSGIQVTVALRPASKSRETAHSEGLSVADLPTAVAAGDVVVSLIPDERQADVIATSVAPYLQPGSYLGFGHGFAIRFGGVKLPENVNVFLVAPRGPGRLIRRNYESGMGCACSIAVENDPSGDTLSLARTYALAIGAKSGAIRETTFAEECEADLFGEQAVLCGGVVELMKAGYETLVGAGYSPEMAYLECVHEVKLVVDLIYEHGIAGMRQMISNAARFGGLTRGPRVIGDESRKAMRQILDEIRNGRFAKELIVDGKHDGERTAQLADREAGHPMEAVGRALRASLIGKIDSGG